MSEQTSRERRLCWARFRFSVIAPLLTQPPPQGQLRAALAQRVAQPHRHPLGGPPVHVGRSTAEKWYYLARSHPDDPVAALMRKSSPRAGRRTAMSAAWAQTLQRQYHQHPSWSRWLHHQNLEALAKTEPDSDPPPSYATLCRFMNERGWMRRKRNKPWRDREQRSFESSYVLALVHADFHYGSRRVLLPDSRWRTPVLFGCLDDRSRVCLHLQWYLTESAETFVHGLWQAILKRGLFRALLTDNGQAMMAAEVQQGLQRLGVEHATTLPACPEQNGKQESFWGKVEGQLMPMLESKQPLTLAQLNHATQAWVELDYHRRRHRELGQTPLEVFCQGPQVGRKSPPATELRRRFRAEVTRKQRRTDGTFTVDGVRFEVPAAYRHLRWLTVQWARWDRASVGLIDPHSGRHLAELWPLDKRAHASGKRRVLQQPRVEPMEPAPAGIAPHLSSLLERYDQTQLAPAYLPHEGESSGWRQGPSKEREPIEQPTARRAASRPEAAAGPDPAEDNPSLDEVF